MLFFSDMESPLAHNEEYEQLLYRFFYELEKEFHDGVDRSNHRWRQERYELWKAMGQRGLIRQMEYWFKGELAVFLDTLKKERHMIVEWDCEFPRGAGKIDYWVNLKNGLPPLALEVKCLVEGKQGKGRTQYTTSMDQVVRDIMKIRPESVQLYCLLFMYPALSEERLDAIKRSFSYHMRINHVAATAVWKDPYYPFTSSGLSIGKVEIS